MIYSLHGPVMYCPANHTVGSFRVPTAYPSHLNVISLLHPGPGPDGLLTQMRGLEWMSTRAFHLASGQTGSSSTQQPGPSSTQQAGSSSTQHPLLMHPQHNSLFSCRPSPTQQLLSKLRRCRGGARPAAIRQPLSGAGRPIWAGPPCSIRGSIDPIRAPRSRCSLAPSLSRFRSHSISDRLRV
jgi:hypothetical protein